jgi:hypothetical protein
MRIFVKKKGLTISRKPLILFGSPARTRTADPVVNSHLLCQLSYWGMNLQMFNLTKLKSRSIQWLIRLLQILPTEDPRNDLYIKGKNQSQEK